MATARPEARILTSSRRLMVDCSDPAPRLTAKKKDNQIPSSKLRKWHKTETPRRQNSLKFLPISMAQRSKEVKALTRRNEKTLALMMKSSAKVSGAQFSATFEHTKKARSHSRARLRKQHSCTKKSS